MGSDSDLVGNEIFERLQLIQGRELAAALTTVRKLRHNLVVSDGDLADALYALTIRLDVASPLLPVCHELLKRFMKYGGLTDTPEGLKREWLEQCVNPNCIDGKISVGCAVDQPALTSDCPDCAKRKRTVPNGE